MAERSIEKLQAPIARDLNRLGRFASKLARLAINNLAADIIFWPAFFAAGASVVYAGCESIASLPTSPPIAAPRPKTIKPASRINFINTAEATRPYYPGGGVNGIHAAVDCGFSPEPQSKKLTVDKADYASAASPVINRLVKQGKPNAVRVQEIDHVSNIAEVGWADSFYVSVTANHVKISDAADGESPLLPDTGPSSPDGSFTLKRGNLAVGKIGLMDFELGNVGGEFYIQVQCDPQKTEQLLHYDNATSPAG